VQVRIVRGEALVERQLGAEREVHGMRLVAPLEAERLHQAAHARGLVVERFRDALDAPPRETAGLEVIERGTLACRLRRVVGQQVPQPAAPFRKREPRLRQQPGNTVQLRKVDAAGQTGAACQARTTGRAGEQIRERGRRQHPRMMPHSRLSFAHARNRQQDVPRRRAFGSGLPRRAAS
jgi:hypothetical protein